MRPADERTARVPRTAPALAFLLLAAAAVSVAFLSGGNDADGAARQAERAATVVAARARPVLSARSGGAAVGALVAAPRDQGDARAMVEFCDTATAADVPALREVALTARDPLAAGNAVRALGRLRAVSKDADLVKLLDDPRERVRDETILALGESRDASALGRLEQLVRSVDPHVRVLAIRAVGRVGGARARSILEQVADDPSGTPESAAFARAGLVASWR